MHAAVVHASSREISYVMIKPDGVQRGLVGEVRRLSGISAVSPGHVTGCGAQYGLCTYPPRACSRIDAFRHQLHCISRKSACAQAWRKVHSQ